MNPSRFLAAQKCQVRLSTKPPRNPERDSEAICTALTDPKAEIRLKASAIYLTIIQIEPKLAFVARECTSGLLRAASESEDRVRNNALFVLAMNPGGALPGAGDVFRTQLQSANLRSAEVAAAGLLHAGRQDDENLVLQSLLAAPDSAHRVNMLYAISGSRISSNALFQASSELLSDEDADVQEEAINAMVASSPSKSLLSSGLDRINSLPNASAASKRHARLILNNLSTQ